MDSLKIDFMKLSPAPFIRHSEAVPSADSSSEKKGVSFESLLTDSMKNVNNLQLESDTLVNKLATGDVEDVSTVVLSVQRAEFALRMITEVRNKLVDAYQQLGRLPV